MLLRIALFSILAVSLFGQTPSVARADTPAVPATSVKTPETAPPQAPKPGEPIHVEVNEVIVPVTVTDDKGRFVSDLEQKDFRIFDEGREQRIEYFSRERSQPVVVGFLIDMSNASRMHWKDYKDAAIELVDTLITGDKKYSGYLLSFASDAEILVNTTHDPEVIAEKMRKLKPGGGAALYDAVWKACTSHDLVKGEPIEPRRVLIIVGDGHDTASRHTLAQAVEIAQRNLVTIYCISTVSFGAVTDDEQNLVQLAKQTGGRVESPLQKVYQDVSGYISTPMDEGNYVYEPGTGGYAMDLSNGMYRAIEHIAGEVTTQYILRYVPDVPHTGKEGTKEFRNIRVDVDLPNVTVRARRGYYPFNL